MNDTSRADTPSPRGVIDHSSDPRFFEYYKKQSESETSLRRFRSLRHLALAVVARLHGDRKIPPLKVADIGCGAGAQALMWAGLGHQVYGIDVNEPLVRLARERTQAAGLNAEYRVGTAAALPWPDRSMDVCLVPELLEHVVEWRQCLDEFARILAPSGVLLLTTTNWLCPVQDEFNLPLYSWYPPRLKRYCEHLARTSHPKFANFAKYPAVNWFSAYSLEAELRHRGLQPMDRFSVARLSEFRWPKRIVLRAVQSSAILRFVIHVMTPYTLVIGVRRR